MTYYKVTKWRNEIEPIEFEKVTAKFGFLRSKHNGKLYRESLDSEYQRCLPTREESVRYVHARLIAAKIRLTSNLEDATARLKTFEQKEGLA